MNPAPTIMLQLPNGGSRNRDWILPSNSFRFYLNQRESDGLWRVVDRTVDLAVVQKGYKTKRGAHRAFERQCNAMLAQWEKAADANP